MLIVRENTECLLVAKEQIDESKGRATAERVITRVSDFFVVGVTHLSLVMTSVSLSPSNPSLSLFVCVFHFLDYSSNSFDYVCLLNKYTFSQLNALFRQLVSGSHAWHSHKLRPVFYMRKTQLTISGISSRHPPLPN